MTTMTTMTRGQALAHASLTARAELARQHAANALRRLREAREDDRIRRPGHGTERTSTLACKRLRRALREVARIEAERERVLMSD